MSKSKLIAIFLLLAIVLIGCGSSDETVNENTDNETTEPGADEKDANNSGEILSLGETGIVESVYGDFEITFEAFQFMDEIEGEAPFSDVFILMNATVKNIGDLEITGSDFYTATLFDDEGSKVENDYHNEYIQRIEDTLKPGGSAKGQFLFDTSNSDHYELIFNHNVGAAATELTWEFSADEESEEAIYEKVVREENEEDSTEEDGEDIAQVPLPEISEEERERLLERFDEHLLLGETGEFERSDITKDHVSITLNSFTFVDELDGEKPKNDYFLLANVTVENLLSDENYGKMFIRGIAEGRTGGTNQDERDELAQEFNKEEPGISTGNLVFDMEASDYYTLSILTNKFLIFTDERTESESE